MFNQKINAYGAFSQSKHNEAQLYHRPTLSGSFTISQRKPGAKFLRQISYKNSKFPEVIQNLLDGGGYQNGDCYVSQASFSNESRQIAHLQYLLSAYTDLDFYAENAPLLAKQLGLITRPEDRATFVIDFCDERRIPLPSHIVHTGRGLYLKWLFDTELLSEKLPAWNDLQASILSAFYDLGADKMATDGSRIFRVCGTRNIKALLPENEEVRVIWTRDCESGSAYTFAFGALCDALKPSSTIETSPRPKIASSSSGQAVDQRARQLWWDRLEDIRHLVKIRYGKAGVPEGIRNSFCWIVANALSYNVPAAQLRSEVLSVFHEMCPGYTAAEIQSSASSVVSKVSSGQAAYRISNDELRKKLSITPEEERQLKTYGGVGARRNIIQGVMGFERMHGLTHEEYTAETTRRKQEAAKHTNAMKSMASEDNRAMALKLRVDGLSIGEIAEELGISKSTAHAWTKK
ncbi:helix-turn-helix domain-containing protein [Actimicrobium sp. CCI2.3]|uniref:helix-turn-helix domain-containing protein n=1 Tax=Actimicrobium sp. CCI2.3 TaxID=3048616 RepID=UPI002B24E5F1|nr:helix-turn-helix domain-containing protein [Actimicrobium sp. CCI2.3]MEB0023796.1 helix-turn-helix domain-containing protein [Actimicrobium sp. CCI2.3]